MSRQSGQFGSYDPQLLNCEDPNIINMHLQYFNTRGMNTIVKMHPVESHADMEHNMKIERDDSHRVHFGASSKKSTFQ